MAGSLSNCIAWGVDDLKTAIDYYQVAFGFSVKTRGDGWVELDTGGPLRVYLCDDDGRTPTFEFDCDDVSAEVDRLSGLGFEKVGEHPDGRELYVRDRYGRFFAISPR